MEQTWFDLPVESRLTEVWPKGLLKKNKLVPQTCKPNTMTFPMPYWNLPVVPMDQKMPLLPGPKDLYHLARSKLGEKLWGCEDSEFSLNEFISKEIFNAYQVLHDQHLAHFLRRPIIVRRLKELGLIDSQMGVMCNLRDYNLYRRYLAFVHNNAINKLYKNQFLKGDSMQALSTLMVQLERQNAKARVDEEIDQRHAQVFQQLLKEKMKKDAICGKRLRRVDEVFFRKLASQEAQRISAREASKEYTKKVKENKYYANAQLRQHKLDTMRKWRKQNTEKAALFIALKKKRQQDLISKKTEWFKNKIKHQEKRILQETQINVLMDHEFSPEYKRYLKYIRRENYKNPSAQATGPEYLVSSESEVEDSDLLKQLKLFSKAGYQLERGSFISRSQAKQSVAKLTIASNRYGLLAAGQVRRVSEKFMKEKRNIKGKKSYLDALINSSVLRLLSPSLQEVFKKSGAKWKNKRSSAADSLTEQNQTVMSPFDMARSLLPPQKEPGEGWEDEDDGQSVSEAQTLFEELQTDSRSGQEEPSPIHLGKDSDIEIRPPNKSIPPPPICHLNVYRYFDRVLGKVILEYVTRILLPKFPEIINRCHSVSKTEGLPNDWNAKAEALPCHPEDSTESYTDCIEVIKDICDKKMATYLLLLSESPDMRLFRHKFNGIGEITCPESLVGNFLVQSSPHSQHILDYIHWRADWILNYPPPKTYQEIYDLKYVIGVMRNIECPVFQPIYKLWEITNDINLNPEVLEKFAHYLEKKKEQKPTIELKPVDIAVKNVSKIIGPLKMDYNVAKEVDDYCVKDLFKVPSELFRMTYLKRPVDPKIWKVIDELLDKTKKRPEELECLKCEPDELQHKLSLNEHFEELEARAPECLFVDVRDYRDELRKAKDKVKDTASSEQFVRFGITEFIPYIEAELFGKHKSDAPDEDKDELNKMKKKKPSILRLSNVEKEIRLSINKKVSVVKNKFPHQKKETNLAAKLQVKPDSKDSKKGDKKKKGEDAPKSEDKEKKAKSEDVAKEEVSVQGDKPPQTVQQKTSKQYLQDMPAEEDTAVSPQNVSNTDKSVKDKENTGGDIAKARPAENKNIKDAKSSKSASRSSKDSKSKESKPKDKKGKDKKDEERQLGTSKGKSKKDKTAEEVDCSKFTALQNSGRDENIAATQVEYDSEIEFQNSAIGTTKLADDKMMRKKAASIMKRADSSTAKSDLNVKFTSKKYVEPHILKSLDINDELKKIKDRLPTPHPSYTSLDAVEYTKKQSIDISYNAEEEDNLVRYKQCTALDSADSIPTQPPTPPPKIETPPTSSLKKPEDLSVKQRVESILKQNDKSPKKEVAVTEVVVTVIEAEKDASRGESSEVDRSRTSIDSDMQHLEKFITSKLPRKFFLPEKQESDEDSGTELVPVPPIVNKSLLPHKRIIKRPLANILRKIYGWVMTTVIRRRLLISYGLPPKISKECFYKKKFDSNDLDLARGLAKLILEEPSEYYPFALLEPYIETILDQTMDPSKRHNFTKRVIRMENPLSDESLQSLKKFLFQSEQDHFFKKNRTRRLKKFSACLKMKAEAVLNYYSIWGGKHFDPHEWLEIFETPKVENLAYICMKRKRNLGYVRKSLEQQNSAFVSYGADSPSVSRDSSSASVATPSERNKSDDKIIPQKSEKNVRKSLRESAWMKAAVQKDPYDEWRPGFTEQSVSSRKKMLDIVINKVADVTPSITDISEEMRQDFSYHKIQRRWMEKERQIRFISNLNMFNPILPPKGQDRKLMKFVQSKTYPYFGTFLDCQTFTERHQHIQKVKHKT